LVKETPPQAARGAAHDGLIDLAVQVKGALEADLRRMSTIGTHHTLADLFLDLEPDQLFD
jgi:hypothetical protein